MICVYLVLILSTCHTRVVLQGIIDVCNFFFNHNVYKMILHVFSSWVCDLLDIMKINLLNLSNYNQKNGRKYPTITIYTLSFTINSIHAYYIPCSTFLVQHRVKYVQKYCKSVQFGFSQFLAKRTSIKNHLSNANRDKQISKQTQSKIFVDRSIVLSNYFTDDFLCIIITVTNCGVQAHRRTRAKRSNVRCSQER